MHAWGIKCILNKILRVVRFGIPNADQGLSFNNKTQEKEAKEPQTKLMKEAFLLDS